MEFGPYTYAQGSILVSQCRSPPGGTNENCSLGVLWSLCYIIINKSMAFGNGLNLKSLSCPWKIGGTEISYCQPAPVLGWGSQIHLISITRETTVALITLEILRCLGTVNQSCGCRPDISKQYILVI